MDLIYSYAIPVIWIAWFIYWRAMAGNVKRTVRREPVLWRVIYIGLLVLGASVFTVFTSGRSMFFAQIYQPTFLTFWLGVTLMLFGFAFTSWARIILGRNWSATVTMKEGHELVETGPYAWVRHPIYTGLLLMFLGTAVAIGQWRGVAAIILVLVSFLMKMRLEEKWMTELFGDRYTDYRRRVAMLIPGLW